MNDGGIDFLPLLFLSTLRERNASGRDMMHFSVFSVNEGERKGIERDVFFVPTLPAERFWVTNY
jgi:hypothetical protein